jgi:hypothetical protein
MRHCVNEESTVNRSTMGLFRSTMVIRMGEVSNAYTEADREADVAEVRAARRLLHDSACTLIPRGVSEAAWMGRPWTLRIAREHGIKDKLVHIAAIGGRQ